MAGSSVIGSLRVALGLDSANFETGVKKAKGLTGELDKAMKALQPAALIGATGVAALTAAFAGAKATAQWADDLDAAATKIGVTAEALQELRHAAEVNDIPIENLDDGLRNLNATLGAMQSGVGNAKIKKAFEAIGIKDKDLKSLNDASDLLPILADHIAKLGTQAEQVQIAKKLGVEDLLPLLQQGSKGIGDLQGQFKALGMEMSNGAVTRYADLNEQMRVADERMKAAGRSLLVSLIPGLAAAKTKIAEVAAEWTKMIGLISGANTDDLSKAYAKLYDLKQLKTKGFSAINEADGSVNNYGAPADIDQQINDQMRLIQGLRAQTRWTSELAKAKAGAASAGGGGSGGKGGGKTAKGPTYLLSEPNAARDNWAVGQVMAGLEASKEAGAIWDKIFADAAKADQDALDAEDERIAKTSERLRREEEAAKDLAQRLRDESHDALLEGIEGALNAAAHGDLLKYFGYAIEQQAFKSLAGWIGGSIEGSGSKDLMSVAKFLLPGFANGGSMMVGGAGGIDSQVVGLRATPGETIHVTKPGQALGGGAEIVVHVQASPYFDARVQQVAAPMAMQAALAGRLGAARDRQRAAQQTVLR
jgi:hypothetical protein